MIPEQREAGTGNVTEVAGIRDWQATAKPEQQ